MTHFSFRMPRPTKVGIKVICTSFRFAAVERQTVKRKTLKIWVKFGVAAPRPWGRHQNLNPRVKPPGHSSNRNIKQKFRSCYRFPNLVGTVFPLTFWQNFVKKFPCPSPSPGVHHVWNLSRRPQALAPKKIWAPHDPPRGRYGGSKFQLPPLPPHFPFVKGRSSSVHGPGSSPATIPEILVNLRATQPEIFSLSYGPPAPGIYRGQKPIKRSLLFCWILLHTLRDRSRRGQRRDPQYGAPNIPTFGMSRDRIYYHGDVSDGSYDSEMPKTPNRK